MKRTSKESRIHALLRDCIDFSTAEKAEMLRQLPVLSRSKRAELVGILQRSAERFTVLMVQYPHRAQRKREESQKEWDSFISLTHRT